MYQFAQLLPLIALLAWAAMIDFRRRRIPNWLNAILVVTGLASSMLAGAWTSPLQSLAGIGVGFAIGLVLFVIKALTGGDVKLLAGIGAWLGTVRLLEVMAAAAVVGLLIVIVQSLRQRRLAALLRSSAVLSVSLVNGDASTAQAVASTEPRTFAERTLPYSLSIAVGTVLVAALLP
jgi:prepilin peptidase CpaA